MKRKGRVTGVVLGIGTVAAMVAIAWQQSDLGRASRELEKQQAAARAEGVPIEWDDLRRFIPPVPNERNAAVPYRRAFETLQRVKMPKGFSLEQASKDVVAGTLDPSKLQEAHHVLAAAGPALTEAEAGAKLSEFSIDRPWELGPAVTFPELAPARNVVRALALRAMLATDPAAAARDLRTAAHLRKHMGAEPILISALVGVAMEAEIHRGIRFVGSRGPEWAQAVEPVLNDLGPVPDLHRVLAGESVMGRHLTDFLANHGASSVVAMGDSSTPPELRFAGLKPVRDAFESRIIEYWRAVYAALPKDPLDWHQANRATSISIPNEGASRALLRLASPSMEQMGALAAREEAERRLTSAALSLWQGRTSPVPNDPFGAGKLRMIRQGQDWKLWSLGPDGIDNGGRERDPRKDDRGYDMVVKSRPGK